MKPQTKEKNQTTIELTSKELKNILSEYEPDILRDNDNFHMLKIAMSRLDKSDKIILALYSELQSERKVAEILGVSRSPVHKLLCNIRQQIMDYLENKE